MQAVPIRFHGYELSCAAAGSGCGIGEDDLRGLRDRPLRWQSRRESRAVHRVPFAPRRTVPVGAVWYQLFGLLRKVNGRRRAWSRAPPSCVRPKRHIYRPFAAPVEIGSPIWWGPSNCDVYQASGLPRPGQPLTVERL